MKVNSPACCHGEPYNKLQALHKSPGMDLPFKNMYDTFKDEIWKELGPLDPDWFDVLTAQSFTNEGSVSDQDDLCANQEGMFKTPFDKTASDSQLFSTPRVFRHNRVVSPQTDDEQLFTTEQEKEALPWIATQSPCWFRMSKDRVPGQDSFDLLDTPQKSPVSYAKHICESLGAQIHPDVSWTSSLNTPPAVPSTLILSKNDDSPCPVSVSADKNVIFVRKLFPSLSNASRVGAHKDNDMPTLNQGGGSPEAGQKSEPCVSPQSSLNESDGVCRQKHPDAIEDGEIQSTVPSVLDGAENVLPKLFTNSSSALRKAKTDRIKRKQIILTKEDGCSSVQTSITSNAVSSEQITDAQEPVKHSSTPPVKTGDIEMTQWSPLNFSEISPYTVDISCHDRSPATQVENSTVIEQLQSYSDSGQQVRPPLTITGSGFTKKKRKFVYTVETSKTQVQEKEIQSEKTDSSPAVSDFGVSVKQLGKARDEADCSSIGENEMQKQENITEDNAPLTVEAKVLDLDMSQLCRDFAQDFSQMPDSSKLSKVAEDTPQIGFSPSACLSAMKRARQKASPANLDQDCDGVGNRRHVSANNQNYSLNEGTVSDSGFQSGVADITHLTTTSSVLPSLENSGQSQQWSGFETDIHRSYSFLSSNKGNGKAHLEILQETNAKLPCAVKENQTLDPGGVGELHIESTSTQLPNRTKGTADSISYIPLGGQEATTSLSSVHVSGFKTASNKDIGISLASLDRAKCLFEEDETKWTFHHQPTKTAHDTNVKISVGHGSVKNANGDTSCQLTASQKADVTELCTLLEEADSQFEFTQFKSAKLKQHCQDNATTFQSFDKELDPDLLTGIDFDDSFSSDTEKHLTTTTTTTTTAVMPDKANCETSEGTCKSTLPSAMKKENSSTEDASLSSKHISEDISSITSAEPNSLDTAGYNATSKQDNKNPLVLDVGFKTAGGNVLKVSKKCLSRARALFADFENLTDQRSPDEQGIEMNAKVTQGQVKGIRDTDATQVDTIACQCGLGMASGKEISVSAKAIQEADAFVKDCSVMNSNTDMSASHKKCIEPLPGSVTHKKYLPKFKNVQETFSEEPISEFQNVNAGPAACHSSVQCNVETLSFAFKNTQAITNAVSFYENPSTTVKCSSPSWTSSKNIDFSAVNESSSGGGFYTASGKKVSVSADAMKKAECLLSEIHRFEDTNKQLKQKGDALSTGNLINQVQVVTPKNGGFQTASGKGVVISSAALKKAESLLSECDAVEDKTGVKQPYSKLLVPGPSPRNSGFLAASGKPMALSAEALQKAKALFSDISFSAKIPAVSDTRNCDKKLENAGKMDKVHCGFMTAGGAAVHVSQKNLLKAKNLLKEFDDGSISAKAIQVEDAFFTHCDNMDSNSGTSLKYEKSVAPLSQSGSEKKSLSKFDPRVTNTSGDSGSGCSEFDNAVASCGNMQLQDDEIHECVFKNTPHSISPAPLHGNSSFVVKTSPLCTASKNMVTSAFNELSNNGGFCTASGKKVFVSDDAMTKAKSLLNESAELEDTNKLKQNEDTLPPHSSGFQTASGKRVAVSCTSLKTAKTLLSECEGVNENIGVKPTHSKIPVPSSPPRNSSSSLKSVDQRANVFNDSLIAEVPDIPDTMKSNEREDALNNTEEICSGFTTAGGAKVNVSQKNLLKAKKLLKEFADGDCHDSNAYSSSLHDAHKSDQAKVKDVRRTSDSNLTTASYKDMPVNEGVPRVVKSFLSLQEADNENEIQTSGVNCCISIQDKASIDAHKFKKGKTDTSGVDNNHDLVGEEMATVLDCDLNQTHRDERLKFKRTEQSSDLVFQSLNLSGCTETQQMFLAQEAFDCTKALLEDEGLAGQSFSMPLENVPPEDNQKSGNRFVKEQKGSGKRSVEDADVTGQPPLKRRLLEEFDRTVEGPRGSTLHPEISSPDGVMKDRIFKYSVSLQPNITRPHVNGKNYVETRLPTQHSTPGDSRSAHSKMPVFVSPFHKNVKTETPKNTVLRDNTRTQSAFIPPFKKQRTIVQESYSKKQEEDKHHHVPSNSNTYVPPTKKTQSSADVAGNNSKLDIQPVALGHPKNDNPTNNQNVPVGCGSEVSVAEPSHVENTLSRSQEMFHNLENLELARDMQDMRIRKKKRQTIRPLPGSLFLTKTSGVVRISLKAAVAEKPPAKYTQKQLYAFGVLQHVSEITSETAESFRFNLQQFFKQEVFMNSGGVQVADGGWLISRNDGTAGKEEFYRALCDTPGVDPKLISEEWVYNHYRWIVWKQASIERSFPEQMGSRCLTPEQVLLQLKYRYDVEVDHSRRPALRKIMEKDDTAAKTLVLCVCGVVSRGHFPNRQSRGDTKTLGGADARGENPFAVVWLTDGWYAIKAQLDEPLTAMLHKGRLVVGGKLIIHGAQLVGSQDACSPLEAPESLMLKICANSSRPARWDTKLGFHRDPRPFLLPVSCLYSNGGPVGCVDIIILRSYPIQWMERKPDRGVVFRSVRAEEKEERRYSSLKQKANEILFAKIQAEFEQKEKSSNRPQRRRRTISHQDIASLQDGEELYEAVGDDPTYFEAHLSEQQLETLHTYRRALMEKKQSELQDQYRRALEAEDNEGSFPKRDVTPVWRLCIADSMEQSGRVYQLNLWRPSSDLQTLLKEGCRYKVYNLTTSDGKKHSGVENVQLTGTKKTQFQDLQVSQEWLSLRFQPRISADFEDLQNPEFQSLCGEVDLTGYVISIVDGQGSSPAFYLADGKLNFIKVRCFSSLSQSGLEDVVKPRVLLALSNLQLRGQSTSPTPVVYAGDLTVFSTNSKEGHLQESLSQLRNIVQGQDNFYRTAEEKLSHLVNSNGPSSISSPALQPRTSVYTAERRQNTRTSQSVRSLGSFTPVSRNPPAGTSPTEKEPRSLKRKRALDYLSRIPSPPALSHLGSLASPCVNKMFNPPRRSGTDSTVQTRVHKPVGSPVEDEWVNDEELAMIDTQALCNGDVL